MRKSILLLSFVFAFFSPLISEESSEIVKIVNVESNSVNLEIADKIRQYGDFIVVIRDSGHSKIKPMNKVKYNVSHKYSDNDLAVMTGLSNHILYFNGSEKQISYSELQPDTYYSLDIYKKNKNEYDLFSEILFTTLAEQPQLQSQRIMWSDQSAHSFRIYAAGGNGRYTLIVIGKKLNDFVPVDGVSYIVSSEYGKGSEISDGTYVIHGGNDTNKSVLVTGLESGTNYFIKTFEFNGQDKSCNYATQVTPLKNGIKLPTLLESPKLIAVNKSGTGNIKVEWSLSNGAKNYEIEVANEINFEKPDEIYGNIDVGLLSSFTLEEMALNKEYFIRVRASNESGTSDYSNILSIKL